MQILIRQINKHRKTGTELAIPLPMQILILLIILHASLYFVSGTTTDHILDSGTAFSTQNEASFKRAQQYVGLSEIVDRHFVSL